MSNMDSDYEEDEYTQNLTEFAQDFEENEYIDSNILNLDDNRLPESNLQENLDDELSNGTGRSVADGTVEHTHEKKQIAEDGVLTEGIIRNGLSNLGRTAQGTSHVYLHLTLPGYNVADFGPLESYVHLQKIEMPYNNISDLSAFSSMPYLLEIDLSHNQIKKLLDFNPPKSLQKVNLAYNEIEEMSDLSAHHSLTSLTMDNNKLTEIKGIQNCKRLTTLSLAHNKIEKIEGLDNLPIKCLDLRSNKLRKIEGLETLKFLVKIALSGNQIRSLEGLEGHDFLSSIDLEDNEVIDLLEVEHIRPLRLLRELNLQRNPLRELPDYRLAVLYHLQQLTELDMRKVETDEKVSAYNMFNPPIEVIAARDHIMHVVYSFLQPARILDSTLPNIETPYPMLVLVGPEGAGKKDLVHKLVEDFPDYFGLGVLHTTRPPNADEMDKRDYNFVTIDEFENDIKMGKFILTYNNNGFLYGLQIDALEAVARESLACVTFMELEGVLSLKNSHFEPRFVLMLPMSVESHSRRLQERGFYSESHIEWALERTALYAEYNREHPGFFDMMINSDDITEAYYRLRKLVMEYLALGPSTPEMSEALDTPYTGQSLYDRENTTDTLTMGSANMATRTWSKPSITDSTGQNMAVMRAKTMSPVPPPSRGVVEEESLRRRRSAAKDAVTGHRPTLYEQLISSTVPQPVSAQLGLDDRWRAHSAPVGNMDTLPASSPDSSDDQSCVTSSLSNISEAQIMTEANPEGSISGSAGESHGGHGQHLSQPAVDPLQLSSGSTKSDTKTHSGGLRPPMPLTPRPGYDELSTSKPASATQEARPSSGAARPGSGAARPGSGAARPGSDKHPVLPPIGSPAPPPMLPEE